MGARWRDQRLDERCGGPDEHFVGVAYCTTSPLSITAILSARWKASSMSCVTRMIVVPKCSGWRRGRPAPLARMIGSSAPKARPSGARWAPPPVPLQRPPLLLPPESSWGNVAVRIRGIELEQLQQSSTLACAGFFPAEQRRHCAMFCGPSVREEAMA